MPWPLNAGSGEAETQEDAQVYRPPVASLPPPSSPSSCFFSFAAALACGLWRYRGAVVFFLSPISCPALRDVMSEFAALPLCAPATQRYVAKRRYCGAAQVAATRRVARSVWFFFGHSRCTFVGARACARRVANPVARSAAQIDNFAQLSSRHNVLAAHTAELPAAHVMGKRWAAGLGLLGASHGVGGAGGAVLRPAGPPGRVRDESGLNVLVE